MIDAMSTGLVTRETKPNGDLQLSAAGCTFVYRRMKPGALLITIKGNDKGQFGTGTLDEIRLELLRNRPLEIFVDAREATGVAAKVSEDWTQFFSLNRDNLVRVSVLVSSKFINLTVAIAQHLSRTGNLIQIYSDPKAFSERVAAAAP